MAGFLCGLASAHRRNHRQFVVGREHSCAVALELAVDREHAEPLLGAMSSACSTSAIVAPSGTSSAPPTGVLAFNTPISFRRIRIGGSAYARRARRALFQLFPTYTACAAFGGVFGSIPP